MKRKKRRSNKKKQQNIMIPFLLLIVLLGGVLFTSKTILKDIKTSISITNIKNTTFNYTNKNDTVVTIFNKKISDADAISSGKKYSFEVLGNNEFEVKIVDLSDKVDYKYVKLFLTDENDKPLKGFETPKTYNELEETENGRVLYCGKGKNRKLNLIVWIDKNYNENKTFSYKLIIE